MFVETSIAEDIRPRLGVVQISSGIFYKHSMPPASVGIR